MLEELLSLGNICLENVALTFVKVSPLIYTYIYTSINLLIGDKQWKHLAAAILLWDLHEFVTASETELNLSVYFSQLNSLGESFSLVILTICSSCWGQTLWPFTPLTRSSSCTIAFPLLLYSVSGDKQIISACASVVGSLWLEVIWWFGSSLQSCLSFGLNLIDLFVFACFIFILIILMKIPFSDHKVILKMCFMLLTFLKILLAEPPKGFVRYQTRAVLLKAISQHGKERNTCFRWLSSTASDNIALYCTVHNKTAPKPFITKQPSMLI